tara:strand:+ start:386 stop:814 length:429 start_codon:yes stop_codon:yes gene_type:complete
MHETQLVTTMGKGISLEELNRMDRAKKAVQPVRRPAKNPPLKSDAKIIRELGQQLAQFEREHFRPREQKTKPQSRPEDGVLAQVFYVICFFLMMNLLFVFAPFVFIYHSAMFFFDHEITYFGYIPLLWAFFFNMGLAWWLDL